MTSTRLPLVLFLFVAFIQLDCSPVSAEESGRWEHPKYVYFVTRIKHDRREWEGAGEAVNKYEWGLRQFTPGINEVHYTNGDVDLWEVSAPVLGPFYSKAELCAGCAHLPHDVLSRFGCLAVATPPGRKKDWRVLLLLIGGGIAWYVLSQRAAGTQLAQAVPAKGAPMSDATVAGATPPSGPAIFGKFLHGRLSDRQFDDLKDLGVDRGTLNAVRNEINQFGQDPVKFLTQAIKENKVVMLDDAEQTQYRDYIGSIMPELKQAGATHLAVDTLARAGKDVLSSAIKAGLKVVPLRENIGTSDLDEGIAREIAKLVASAPNNRVIFWGPSMFATHSGSPARSAADLLDEQLRVVSIAASVEDHKALGRTTHDLRAPVAVPTNQAAGVKRFPVVNRDGNETHGLWDGLIMVPRVR
jgi:hypothetical protein